MDEAGVDALVMQNISEGNGAYTRWFTDMPAPIGYPISVVCERDGTITVHSHGRARRQPRAGPGLAGEVSRLVTTWTFMSAYFCASYEPDALLPVLRRYATGTVGLVGPMQMTASFADGIRAGLPQATIVDASDLVDRVKVVKSPEELDGIRLCAQIQEQVLEALLTAAVPGATEYECLIAANNRSRELGSDGGMIALGSAPKGTAAAMRPLQRSNRVLQTGDRMTILVENNGPGGWYTKVGRLAVLGTADAQLRDEAALALAAAGLHTRAADARSARRRGVRDLQPAAAGRGPATGDAAALPRAGHRHRRATAHPVRRAAVARGPAEHGMSPGVGARRCQHDDVRQRRPGDRWLDRAAPLGAQRRPRARMTDGRGVRSGRARRRCAAAGSRALTCVPAQPPGHGDDRVSDLQPVRSVGDEVPLDRQGAHDH